MAGGCWEEDGQDEHSQQTPSRRRLDKRGRGERMLRIEERKRSRKDEAEGRGGSLSAHPSFLLLASTSIFSAAERFNPRQNTGDAVSASCQSHSPHRLIVSERSGQCLIACFVFPFQSAHLIRTSAHKTTVCIYRYKYINNIQAGLRRISPKLVILDKSK